MTDQPSFADIFAEPQSDHDAAAEQPRLDPGAVFADDDQDTAGVLVDGGGQVPRFDGDTSELSPPVCWALQALVAAPHVSEKSDKTRRHWPIVLQHEAVLRSRLAELGLLLEINREHRHAFTRQAQDPSPHSRVILRSTPLRLAASALALYLYNQYVVALDEPIVERSDMIDHMLGYRPESHTDEVEFGKQMERAIQTLTDASIIKPVRGSEDRFLIYGVITSILTAEQVSALDARYRAIARGEEGAD
ncbi:DUF4194 domain-containing protein [Crossiella sp. CA-258035]|uniref:DUF4194 domain-containing protein n=1 Tax=Crossiella sp. CA-258035 TaxID=2981138 RepID=UPI0024BCC0D7|nr:DUF4194 domain-containing protein [Crossiella sp. CA-258035]WHT22652.1 DUF4194 domain-containing protein [Crossiella sp. CA-258035]